METMKNPGFPIIWQKLSNLGHCHSSLRDWRSRSIIDGQNADGVTAE